MKKRTNNIYNVQVVKYAWIPVEADSVDEAMKIASSTDLDDYIDDEEFEECEIEVHTCETYCNEIDGMFLSDDDYVLTKDGAMTAKEYREALEYDDESK